jgi:transcriptional regulator with XRE-family HTH domain
MDTAQSIAIRNRIIGILIQRARTKAGKTQRECAEFLGCSPFIFSQYEQGQKGIGLPQLEALAYLFDVPVASLWDEQFPEPEEADDELLHLEELSLLRRKILAVQLRQCRMAAGLSQRDLGELVGRSAAVISQYEHGKRDIPLAELEVAAEQCNKSLASFLDDEALPLSPADRDRQALAYLGEMSPDVREFVLKPSNALYLRIALLLSAMKADSLRQIAETILDITY